MITYKNFGPDNVHVYIEKRLVGYISQQKDGLWRYRPLGSGVTGELFSSLNDCKRSLEPSEPAAEQPRERELELMAATEREQRTGELEIT